MSTETKIMSSVANVISFIKDRVKIDLQEAATRGLVNIEIHEIQKTCCSLNKENE